MSAELSDLRITIITSTLNCSAALERTAESIRCQAYSNIQWIVADGSSVDGTVDVINKNLDLVSNWFSESDSGIYDAWNKACKLIDGDWVIFLGAGDVFFSDEVLKRVCAKLKMLSSDVVIGYGDVYQYDRGRLQFHYGEVDLSSWQTGRPALPCHQGVFQRAETLKCTRPFDVEYKIAADSKQMILVLRDFRAEYIGLDVAVMDMHGVGASPRTCMKVLHELIFMEHDLGYRVPFLNKIKFILVSLFKYALYRVWGERLVNDLARIKRGM